MTKKVIFITILLIVIALLSGCNYDMVDTNYSYDKAIITLNDGTKMELEIKQWKDYEDGEQLQITDKDGNVYLVSSYNTILINTKGE